MQSLPAEYKRENRCMDCVRWEEGELGSVLQRNCSLYEYDEWMKEVVARFKFRGDAVLAEIFQEELLSCFRSHFSRSTAVLPVPLSGERLRERGFNQAALLAARLPVPQLAAVVRAHTEKQSKKSRLERLQGASPFRLEGSRDFGGEHILLVDDIYTTGTTLRQLAALLREHGAASVQSLTLCRS
nr:ComF family protein [Ectobacillus ponti]